jgi:cysteine-rich repeat protein
MRRHSWSIAAAALTILLGCGAASAADITCGQTIERTIERGGQSDSVAYDGGPGDVLSITIVPASPSPDCIASGLTFDPFWELFDPDGRRVEIPLGDRGRRCLGLGGAASCETTALDEPSDQGPYTLIVTDFGKNCSGTYRLTIENVSGTVNGVPFDPADPPCARFNDKGKPDGTQPITRGEPVSGAIDEIGETDTFTFDGQGETVTIQLALGTSSGGTFDPRWTLFDPQGNAVSDDCSTLTCTRGPLSSGVYTIKVFDSDENATGDYTLVLQPQDVTTTTSTTTTTSEAPASSTTTTTLIGPGQALYQLSRTLRRTTSDFAPAEALGSALASDGDRLVIGVPNDQTRGQAAGAAYVVGLSGTPATRNYGLLRRALFKPGGSSANDGFGAAVALLGSTTVAVGAPGVEVNPASGVTVQDAGAVYLFTDGSTTVPELDQPQPVAGSGFGSTLASFGSELFVGAPAEGGFGKVYLFDGTALTQVFDAGQAASDPALVASGAPLAGDRFGFAIAAIPDQLAIGAPATPSRAGRVFLFDRRNGTWQVVQSPTPAANDGFGAALAYVDSTLFIGAPGAGQIFQLTGAGQTPSPFGPSGFRGLGTALAPIPGGGLFAGAPLTGESPAQGGVVLRLDSNGSIVATYAKPEPNDDDQYGKAVVTAGIHLFVGVPGDDSASVDGGAVYDYLFQQGGNVPQAIFRKRLTDAGFGTAVSADDFTIAVGAPTDVSGSGALYTFDPNGSCAGGVCVALGVVKGNPGSRLGQSVAMVDGDALVGAPYEDSGGNVDVGAAYLAQPNRVSPKIENPEGSSGDQFGFAVTTIGTDLLIAAPLLGSTDTGAVFVFDKSDLRNRRVVLRKPVPSTGDFFGAAIAGEGDTVAVGAPFDNTAAKNAGAVHLFQLSTADLLTGQPLVSPDPVERELFGAALAMSTDLIVVGAPSEDGGTHRPGRVYLFDRQSLALLRIIDNPTGAQDDRFGAAVAIVGGRVLIGAPLADTTVQHTGQAYLVDTGMGVLLQTFQNPAQGAFDRFGSSVVPGPGGLLIGAPGPGRVYVYTGAASNSLAVTNARGSAAAATAPRCGDGHVDGNEQCDDGNDIDTDDCRNDCTMQPCCVIDPLAADRCDDFDPCTDDSFDANAGICLNVDNGQCCSSDAACAGDSACRLCAGCSLFPWDCCNQGSTCILNSPQCVDKTCFDEASCECAGGLTCSDGSTATDRMSSDFRLACNDLRLEQDGESGDNPMASARAAAKDARKMLKSAVHETRSAYKSHDVSKQCRGEFIEDIRRVRKSIPTGQKLRKCVTKSEGGG